MIDTFEFHCKVTRHAIETFAKVCYDISGKPNGCFFGYLQDETVGYAGHLGIDELLKSPYIDFMSSPKAYHYCLAGDPGASQAPGQSISNKKLWVEENDSRSYHALKTDGDRAPKSLEDTITVFWREIYRALTMNFTFWWMDIGARRTVMTGSRTKRLWKCSPSKRNSSKMASYRAQIDRRSRVRRGRSKLRAYGAVLGRGAQREV